MTRSCSNSSATTSHSAAGSLTRCSPRRTRSATGNLRLGPRDYLAARDRAFGDRPRAAVCPPGRATSPSLVVTPEETECAQLLDFLAEPAAAAPIAPAGR